MYLLTQMVDSDVITILFSRLSEMGIIILATTITLYSQLKFKIMNPINAFCKHLSINARSRSEL